MAKIPEGCVLLARKIQNNPIWYQKPSWWLKVFEYIFMQANHKDKHGFKRGQCFLNREQIYRDCHLKIEGVTINSVDNVIRYLRQQSILTTQQTTRGFIMTICNYDFYQDLNNYRNEAENEAETKQKRSRNEAINKNDKNVKNENNNIYSLFEKYKEIFKGIYEPRKLTPKIESKIKARLKEFKEEELILALKKIREDDFVTGKNPNSKVYCTPEYCFRSYEMIEKWLNQNKRKQQNKYEAVRERIKKEKEAQNG